MVYAVLRYSKLEDSQIGASWLAKSVETKQKLARASPIHHQINRKDKKIAENEIKTCLLHARVNSDQFVIKYSRLEVYEIYSTA